MAARRKSPRCFQRLGEAFASENRISDPTARPWRRIWVRMLWGCRLRRGVVPRVATEYRMGADFDKPRDNLIAATGRCCRDHVVIGGLEKFLDTCCRTPSRRPGCTPSTRSWSPAGLCAETGDGAGFAIGTALRALPKPGR